MRKLMLLGMVVAALGLTACQKTEETPAPPAAATPTDTTTPTATATTTDTATATPAASPAAP